MRALILVPALAALGGPLVSQEAAPAKGSAPAYTLPYTPSLDVPSMDKSADACTDFYQYVCGGWMKNNPIPADQARWSVYGKVYDENQQFLRGLLEAASRPSAARTASEAKIGDYYAACMDQGVIDRAGSAPIQPELEEIRNLASKAALAGYLGRMHLVTQGSGLGFGFGANQDFSDSTKVIAFASAGGLSLPDRDYYTKTDEKSVELRAKYAAHVRRIFELLGTPPDRAALDAADVLDLETALAKASLTRVEKRDPYKLFHVMGRAEVAKLTPGFDWDSYLREQGVGGIASLNVTEPAFFTEFGRLLEAESLDKWKAYLRWHVAHARAPYLSKAFVDEDFNFYRKTLRGVTSDQPRWKKCTGLVDRDLGEALGQVFVAKTFSPATKAKTEEMTKYVEEAMADEIARLDWMSAETKQKAMEKLGTIVNKVGYPDRWRDYSALDVARGDFMGNVRRAARFESKRTLAKIGRPVDRQEWGMTPPTVNAYYDPQMNDINFPAGVLQPPLYDAKMDDAPNYGNTGSTIGHELTHGFDDEGRQFDAQGNLKDWWTKEDAAGFEERLKCVQDQYAEYVVVDDIRIQSKLTSGEDVADLGGTLIAYLAWQKAVAKSGQKLQPVDGFTPEQRFFIGFGQWACENNRPENQRVSALTDPHSPGKYRINGIVANLPEFARAFSCKPGQPMVREKVCKIW
ncbi:MAG TPA: M13 family metallopeptidase [Vicinamibacteria bacterium]|nr:M13 family metallopeptidase [Vicinamibacteria bacterium]